MRVCDVLVDIVSNMDRGTCQWEMMREGKAKSQSQTHERRRKISFSKGEMLRKKNVG